MRARAEALAARARGAGVHGVARAVQRRARRLATGTWSTARLRARPRRASEADLRAALGRPPAEALAGAAAALPAVRAFRDAPAPPSLLERADAAAAHRFDLLGSGPHDLGARIDWHRDFVAGRRWPLVHWRLIRIAYGDGSDIKVPWELSRCHHLPLLARAHRQTGDDRYADALGRQLLAWIEDNPVELGVNWACAMDVAIRAANWVAALVVLGDAAERAPWRDRVLASLLEHGRFVRAHPEWTPVRGNHYLADVAGLAVVAAVFAGGPEGRAWAAWCRDQLAAEMEHQVHPDGCAHEASIQYHRLVAELFARAAEAVEALGAPLPPAFHDRLARMRAFTADVMRPDGRTPVMGDADDGRFLPLGDHGAADPRDHRHLAGAPRAGAGAYPHGGWAVLRDGAAHVVVHCGEVGMGGMGVHAHNDQLAFDLALGEQPLVVDPGAYRYTSDPAARDALRATAAHATLQVDGTEQAPLHHGLFLLRDRARAEWLEHGPRRFRGRHHGFAHLPGGPVHTRALELRDGDLHVEDRVDSGAAHDLAWSFPLAPGARVALGADGPEAVCGGARLALRADGIAWSVEDGWVSPRYGVRERAPVLRARRPSAPGATVTAFRLATAALS